MANPIKVKQIAQARVKTDVRDALILGRMLAANMSPAIWVPPVHVLNLRYLLSQRRRLNIHGRAASRNSAASCIATRPLVVAYRLLELVWPVLTRKQPYRHFTPERIAYKFLTWSWQLSEEDCDGLTRPQFARYYLRKSVTTWNGLHSIPTIRAAWPVKRSFCAPTGTAADRITDPHIPLLGGKPRRKMEAGGGV